MVYRTLAHGRFPIQSQKLDRFHAFILKDLRRNDHSIIFCFLKQQRSKNAGLTGSESCNLGIIADPRVAAEGGYCRWCRQLSSSLLGRHPRFALFNLSHIQRARRAMLFVMAALQRCCVLICSGDDSPSMRRSGPCAPSPLFFFATPTNAFIFYLLVSSSEPSLYICSPRRLIRPDSSAWSPHFKRNLLTLPPPPQQHTHTHTNTSWPTGLFKMWHE